MSESALLPPRKRRRPALSCVECRRRKIKCDRNDPCAQCTQSRSVSCTYKDGYPGPANGHGAKSSSLVTSTMPPQSNEDLASYDFITHFVHENNAKTQGSTPRTVPLYSESRSNSTTLYSPSAGSPEELQSEQNVQNLLCRVSMLEHNMNTASPGNLDLPSTSSETKDKASYLAPTRVPVPELRGSISKTRLFGQSHWMSSLEHFKKMSRFKTAIGIGLDGSRCYLITTSEIKHLLEKCKIMARAAKAELPAQLDVNPTFRDYVPPRETSDKLVHLYMRTFESTYRILHIPTFEREYKEYWKDPQKASSGFIVKLLLVMAIGTVFYQEDDFHAIRFSALQWVCAAQSWMSAPFEKGRLNFSGLQIHCLVILARQTTGVGGDLVWISVGSLVRMAITMGFHRDPKLFPRMCVLYAELRRRLWATVVEMVVSTSFDSGNPPLISPGDWDTEPPANINDDEIDETTRQAPVPKPSEVYTQTSLQIQLLKSLRTRLKIARIICDFNSNPGYDDILRLGAEILSFGRDGLLLAQSAPEGSLKPTTLQRNLLDTPFRRVLLSLHFPFAMKSRTDPRFYFSRKVCLDAAVTILTYPSTSSPISPHPLEGDQDDYTRLKLVGAGFFKEVLIYASVIIQLELITQLEEESPLMRNEVDRKARESLRQYLAYMVDLSAQRISLGENNIKGHLFLSAFAAEIDALERGQDADLLIAKAAKESAETCYGLLKARIKKPPSSVVMETEPLVGANEENGVGEDAPIDFGTMEMDQEFTLEYLMPDANMDFDIPETWLFEGWEEHHEW